MEWLGGVVDQIYVFFNWIWAFLAQTIYTIARDLLVISTKVAIYTWLDMQVLALDVAYTASQEIVHSLSITSEIKAKYNSLHPGIASGLAYFRVPEALNIIFSALSTRFALRFVPFIGR